MSTLLEQASLVMIPSGYKEDVVYSVIPSSGAGDLSFTRASDGTRINSAGLVENMPYNLLSYSEDFTNPAWAKTASSVTANTTTAPNGTTTADTLTDTAVTSGHNTSQIVAISSSSLITASCFIKKNVSRYVGFRLFVPTNGVDVGRFSIVVDLDTGLITSTLTSGQTIANLSYSVVDFGNGWYRLIISGTSPVGNASLMTWLTPSGTPSNDGFAATSYLGNGQSVYIWGAQLDIGSTAKTYFQTTDRLNVPRLDYSNGTCPALLLEPQRTNVIQYSNDLANAYYVQNLITTTSNYATSPDGTQNAANISFTASNTARLEKFITGTFNNQTHTISVYAKVTSGTQTFRLKCSHAGVADYITNNLTATTDWQRFTFTQAFGSTAGTGIYAGIQNGTVALAKNIQFYGLQLETNSAYVSSLIPTQGASATRVADSCFKTGISSLIGQSEGVLFADFIVNGRTNVTNILNSEKNTTASFYLLARTNGNIDVGLYQSGVIKAAIVAGSVSTKQRAKVAYAYKSGDSVLYINGVQVGTSADTFSLPSTLDDIFLNDSTTYFSYQENVSFNQVILFKTRLTNTELAQLTAL